MNTDEAAFHAAIVEAGDSDLPRLVFADWLEEQGRTIDAEIMRYGFTENSGCWRYGLFWSGGSGGSGGDGGDGEVG